MSNPHRRTGLIGVRALYVTSRPMRKREVLRESPTNGIGLRRSHEEFLAELLALGPLAKNPRRSHQEFLAEANRADPCSTEYRPHKGRQSKVPEGLTKSSRRATIPIVGSHRRYASGVADKNRTSTRGSRRSPREPLVPVVGSHRRSSPLRKGNRWAKENYVGSRRRATT